MYTIGIILATFAVCWWLFSRFLFEVVGMFGSSPSFADRWFSPFHWISYVLGIISFMLIHWSP